MNTGENKMSECKEPADLFEQLKEELPFIPNEEAKQGIINGYIYALLF